MKFKKRYFPKKESEIKNTPYDSLFEKRMHESTLKDARFHNKEDNVSYSVPHTYEPDFVIEENGKTFIIELKGRFQDPATARKYTFVSEYLPETHELVFVWERSNTRFPYAKKRKDGSYMTNEEWSEKHGFRHWTQYEFSVESL